MKKLLLTLAIIFLNLFCLEMWAQSPQNSPNGREMFLTSGSPFKGWKAEQEVVSLRNQNTKHFIDETGKMTAILGAGPIHYQRNGQWNEISTEITYNSSASFSSYSFANERNEFASYYKGTKGDAKFLLSSGQAVTIQTQGLLWVDGAGNALSNLNFLEVNAQVENDKLTYAEVLQNVDMQVKQLSIGAEMDVLIKDKTFIDNRPTQAHFLVFVQTIEVPQSWILTYNQTEKGNLPAYPIQSLHFSANGIEQLRIPAPVFYDQNPGKIASNSPSLKRIIGHYQVTQNGNIVRIQTLVPVSWLIAADRSFPVVIDPIVNVTPTASTYWTGTVQDNSSVGLAFNDGMRVGNEDITWPSDNKYYQSWAKINLTSIPDNACINSATFYLYQTGHVNGSGCDELKFRIGRANTDPVPDPWTTVESQINTLTIEYSRWDAYGTSCGTGCQDYNETSNGWKSFPISSSAYADLTARLASNWITIGIDNLTGYDNHCSGASDDTNWLDWAGYSSSNRPYMAIDYTANDVCADAITVTPGNSYALNTTCAAQDGPAPSCGAGTFREVWYKWTASASGSFTLSTCGAANFDTRIAVFSGNCGAFTEVACNDDACSSTASSLTFNACAGTQYYFAVGGYNGQIGTATLATSFTATAALVAGAVSGGGTFTNNGNPAAFTSTTAASAGIAPLVYQWQSSLNNSTWTAISGATSATYDPPLINQSTYYRRRVTDACGVIAYTNTLTCTVTYTTPSPVAAFTATPTTLIVGQSVSFTNNSSNASSYSWNFGDGGNATTTSPTYTFTTVGTFVVTLTAYGSAGQSGQSHSTTATITVNPLPIYTYTVQNVIFEANSITGTNPVVLSGNVGAHLAGCGIVLKFGGNVNINPSNNHISGNCLVYVPNVQGSNKNIYNGPFDFAIVNNKIDFTSNSLLNMLLKLTQLDLPITDLTLICDGVCIKGDLKLPSSLSSFSNGAAVSAHLDTVSIRQPTGLWIGGEALLTNLRLYEKLKLDTLYLGFNVLPVERFTGLTRLSMPVMKIRGQAVVEAKKMKSIDVWVQPSQPIPLGSSGISLASAGGYVHNINVPSTMKIGLNGTLVPTFPTDLTAITNAYITAEYTMGTSFIATGSLNLFNHSLAQVGFGIYPYMGEVWGNVNWLSMLEAHARFSVAKYPNQRTQLRGLFGATLRMPNANLVQNSTLRSILTTFYSQGQVIATCNNYLTNDYLTGYAAINIWRFHPTASYLLQWSGGLTGKVGMNYSVIPQEARGPLGIQKTSQETTPGYYNFNVAYATQNVIIETKKSSGTPTLELITAWGDTIHSGNVNQYDNIHHIVDASTGLASFWIQNPRVGDYQVHIIEADSLTIFYENVAPTVRILNVTQNAVAKTFTIDWLDNDPDDDAKISLFLDSDNKDANGVIFARQISENSTTDSYTFQYENMPTGDYYVGAIIEDTLGQSAMHYFQQSFRVVTQGAPNAPIITSLTVTDTSLRGVFIPNNASSKTYLLYYSTTSPLTYHSPSIAVSQSSPFEIMNLITPGRTYYFAMTAMDELGRESDLSAVQTLLFKPTQRNAVPYFTTQNYPIVAKVGQPYSFQLIAQDADLQNLIYSATSKPTGMTISNAGLITWIPTASQTGFQNVYLQVTDPDGAYDSLHFQINVLNTQQAEQNIRFDKSTYIEVNDVGIVTFIHPEFNGNIHAIDNLPLKIYSTSDPIGITVTATETQPRSQTFTTHFYTGTFSGGNTLQTQINDTIWVKYKVGADSLLQFANVTQFNAHFTYVSGGLNDTTQMRNASKGANLLYAWDFGDGNYASQRHPNHTYTTNGTYNIQLTITDNEGRTATTSQPITINGIFPVDWLSFEGEAIEKGNMLQWKTTNEVNNDFFVVERSQNGAQFVKIGVVDATVQPTSENHYQFLDDNALVGKSYYRLKQTDIDGSYHYSQTVELVRTPQVFELSVYPNPAKEQLTFEWEAATLSPITCYVYNHLGAQVQESTISPELGKNHITLDVKALASGNYILKIVTQQGTFTTKWVKE